VTLIPFSPYSKVFWIEHQLNPKRTDYHMTIDQMIHGSIDADLLGSAIKLCIDQYPLFKHHVVENKGELFWAEDESYPEWSFFQGESQVERFVFQPFDFYAGCLCRFGLFKLNDKSYRFLAVFHHILLDGRSVERFIEVLSDAYNSVVSSEKQDDLLRQLEDFNQSLSKRVNQLNLPSIIDFWRMFIHPHYSYSDFSYSLNEKQSSDLKETLGRLSFTKSFTELKNLTLDNNYPSLFNVLLILWGIVIARSVGEDYCVVSYPYGIDAKQLGMGSQVNRLLMPIDFSDSESFNDLYSKSMDFITKMKQCRAQYCPLSLLNPDYDLPVFNVGFSNASSNYLKPLMFDGIEVEPRDHNLILANNHIQLFYMQKDNDTVFTIIYDKKKIDDQLADTIAQGYQQILESIHSNQFSPVNTLQLISQEEYRDNFRESNLEETSFQRNIGVHQLFEIQARENPSHNALIHNQISWTYESINALSNQLAHRIFHDHLSKSCESNDTPVSDQVAICVARGADMIIAMLAVMKAGGIYIPFDIQWKKDRLISLFKSLQDGSLLLVDQSYEEILLDVISESVGQAAITVMVVNHDDRARSPENLNLPHDPEKTLALYATSGTMGVPKYVVISHRAVLNQISWMSKQIDYSIQDTLLLTLNFAFSASRHQVLSALTSGATLVISDCEQPDVWINDLLTYPITKIYMVSAQMRLLIDYVAIHYSNDFDCKTLNHVICGSDLVSHALLNNVFDVFPSLSYVSALYGQTEASGCLYACYDRNDILDKSHICLLGEPIANTQLYILNSACSPTPNGVIGELYLSGYPLAKGYWNDDKLTRNLFLKNPFYVEDVDDSIYEVIYKTGDLVRRLSDGSIEYIGRTGDRVSIRGMRVELSEIEFYLKKLDCISQTVVLLHKDSEAIFKPKTRLIAYYVAHTPISDEFLKVSLSASLPDSMIPDLFIKMDSIPLTINGKVDRNQLLSIIDLGMEDCIESPSTPLEKKWATLWCDVLKMSVIGINQNFFALGGDSLDLIQLSHLATKEGMQLSPQMIMQYPTIKALIDYQSIGPYEDIPRSVIDKAMSIHCAPIISVNHQGDHSPFFIIHPAIGGAISKCKQLAEQFPLSQHSIILDSYNLYHLKKPFTSLNELSKHYLKSVFFLQQDGSYVLMGWSLGGLIAVEMAHEIIKKGGSVKAIIMIDSNLLTKKQHHMLNLIWNDELLAGAFQDLLGVNDPQSMSVLKELNDIERDMLRSYYPQKLSNVPCLLIRSSHLSDSSSAEVNHMLKIYQRFFESPTNGWVDVLENLTVINLEADHLSIMTPLHINDVSIVIQRFLNDIS